LGEVLPDRGRSLARSASFGRRRLVYLATSLVFTRCDRGPVALLGLRRRGGLPFVPLGGDPITIFGRKGQLGGSKKQTGRGYFCYRARRFSLSLLPLPE
jgi:hypothetical protein